jgi:glyoxylase-like metal-dependent hydrolase (beta-lactamase superfamily II)
MAAWLEATTRNASPPVARPIDTKHLGLDRVIAAWERDGALIDPGPESSIETVLADLGGEPRAILLTHIHLDHAGATGALVRRFPSLRVYVHESGAPHLADPSKLLRSAGRLYGEDMDRLWGEVVPVPEENIVALGGGEDVEGMRVLYAPGHASHHVAYFDPDSGDAFVGDVGGVLIPPGDEVWMPTPPPDIDVELWVASIAAVRELGPARLALTHFGAAGDPLAHLDAAERELTRLAEAARPGDRAAFMAGLEERIGARPDGQARRIRSAMPPEQVWLGLERYWRKRDRAPDRDSGA